MACSSYSSGGARLSPEPSSSVSGAPYVVPRSLVGSSSYSSSYSSTTSSGASSTAGAPYCGWAASSEAGAPYPVSGLASSSGTE